ncbi:hypothetical protein ACFLWY_01055 [Chloroflexota bacterium]
MSVARLAVRLIWLPGLLALLLPIPASADEDAAKWCRVDIPAEGRLGDWALADGSDVQNLTMAADGTLYCYARVKINGTDTDMLFRSATEGQSWQETEYEGDAITSIVCSATDPDILYVTDGSSVYKSHDAGESFDQLAGASLPALDANEIISCIDVGYKADKPYVFIGTADSDDSDFGAVYVLPEADFGTKWTDLGIGNFDVYSIACSPGFAEDSQLIAMGTDEIHTYILKNYGAIGEWPDRVELLEDNATSFAVTAASGICFTASFDQEYELLVGVISNTGGDVYRVDTDTADDLGIDASIISLDIAGSGDHTQTLAGESGAARVWYSADGGETWETGDKAPTGDSLTYVVMAHDFASKGRAYAGSSGSESAFSRTADGGSTWNQVRLIDSAIDRMVDLAVSPSYSRDETLFLLTRATGGDHSLWRSPDGGATWERTLTSTLAIADSLDFVELSPRYGDGSQVVFVAGARGADAIIWKSNDGGQSFGPARAAPSKVYAWAVADDDTLFVGGYDSSNGLVYRSTNSGASYSEGTIAGNKPPGSIVLSPDYARDETIVTGSSNGWVYCSEDNGVSFEPLPPGATSAPLTGSLTLAFDPGFSSNHTIYAASDAEDKGVYRFVIGESDDWEGIDTTLPSGSLLNQVLVSANGTLYAANSKGDKGMERCLNPTYSLGPKFETVPDGLDSKATLSGLWLHGNTLWSLDTFNNELMTLSDSLSEPVALTSPPDKAAGAGTMVSETEVINVSLDWETLEEATSYEWQLDHDAGFSDEPAPSQDETKASSARIAVLEPATTYYWRVRAIEPMLSPWSDKWSFTTSFGSEATGPSLLYPEAGASGLPIRPVFQWNAVAGAEGYELIVSTRPFLDNPVILKVDTYALPGTAWESNISLDYGTTYYWKVRAISADTRSEWSAVGAFTTEAPPAEEAPAPAIAPIPSPTPAPAPALPPIVQPDIPDWVKYLIGALLLTIILLAVIMLAMVVVTRRS